MPLIITDTREQNHEYIEAIIKKHGGIDYVRTCLDHGMDYQIVGKSDSVGIQRKSGSKEIPKQLSELRNDILPSLKNLTSNPILLIEEDFSIDDNGTMYQRRDSMLYPMQLNVKAYYNFISSIKLSGIDVVTTRNLDASIWWMIATAEYLDNYHYPKITKQFRVENQAIGALCSLNGIGPTKAKKLLNHYSLKDLMMIDTDKLVLDKLLTGDQAKLFDAWRNAKVK